VESSVIDILMDLNASSRSMASKTWPTDQHIVHHFDQRRGFNRLVIENERLRLRSPSCMKGKTSSLRVRYLGAS
jgi:hypothetical protein